MAFAISLDSGKTWITASETQPIWEGFSNNDGTYTISMKYGGSASPTQPPATGNDYWGVKMIYPTVQGGRVWNAPLDKGTKRTLRSGQRDGTDDLCPLGSANYTIDPATKELTMAGDYPRCYTYDSARSKLWENCEITAYYKSVGTTSAIATGYQGFEMSCRGQHELQKGNDPVKTYYSRHSLGGTWWALKEDVHPKSYDKTIKTGVPFQKNVWYGMKFVVRNLSNGNVRLESYRDEGESNNWVKMFDITDSSGTWGAGSSGLPVYNSKNSGCKASFVRTDNATDFRVKKWSIREIAPL